jgi:acetyl esterase/lipase
VYNDAPLPLVTKGPWCTVWLLDLGPPPGHVRSRLAEYQKWITVPAAVGDARVRIVRPQGASGTLPVVVHMHGGGWILGNAATHDRLVRELAVGAGAALLFVEYPNSPEARYPVAIEQGYATAQWVMREGAQHGLDPTRMKVAGESVGGNMAAALSLMAKERGDVSFVQTSMYYPVTDAATDTASYDEFAEGYYLTRKSMERFWDAYPPDAARRSEITASPNQATVEQPTGCPDAGVRRRGRRAARRG